MQQMDPEKQRDGRVPGLRRIRRSEDCTPELIAEHALPALRTEFAPLDRSGDVFGWDPV